MQAEAMEPWWHDGVIGYAVEGPTLGLIVKGFYNLTPPGCLIINGSETGPLCYRIINVGNHLVSINSHAIRNYDNLQWDMGAACQALGIRRQSVSVVA